MISVLQLKGLVKLDSSFSKRNAPLRTSGAGGAGNSLRDKGILAGEQLPELAFSIIPI